MKINTKELLYKDKNGVYPDGYRIVYLYSNGNYELGAHCKTIEGFMIGEADIDPVLFEEVPKFISTEELLNIELEKFNDISGVAIYKTGTCVIKKNKTVSQ